MRRNSLVFWFKLSALTVVLGGVLGFGACGGGSSGDDGDGGGGGNSGGSGGKPGGSGNLQARKVENCSKGKTVGEIENTIIKTSCATTTACHTGPAFGSYKYSSTASFAVKFFNVKPRSYCGKESNDDKVIDTKNPSDSFFLRKLKEDPPKCLNGDEGGERMPQKLEKLDDETITCLEEYIKAVVAN